MPKELELADDLLELPFVSAYNSTKTNLTTNSLTFPQSVLPMKYFPILTVVILSNTEFLKLKKVKIKPQRQDFLRMTLKLGYFFLAFGSFSLQCE